MAFLLPLSKKRLIFQSLAVLLLTAGLVTAKYLVGQNQDIRKKADTTHRLPLDVVSSHPHFWKTGSVDIVGKYFQGINGNATIPGMLAWSGPLYPESNHRFVVYHHHSSLSEPGYIVEWEDWLRSSGEGFRWGGQYANPTNPHYTWAYMESWAPPNGWVAPHQYDSQAECQTNTGFSWPTLPADETLAYQGLSTENGATCTQEYTGSNTGGYIAVKLLEDGGPAHSEYRTEFCNRLMSGSISSFANSICQDAPNAGRINQEYAIKYNDFYYYGCEPLVYIWGYPESSTKNYQNWFRNGELRWADFQRVDTNNPRTDNRNVLLNHSSFFAPSNQLWDAACQYAWDNGAGWVYSGTYRLYTDADHQYDFYDDSTNTPTNTPIPPTSVPPTSVPPTPIPTTPPFCPAPSSINTSSTCDVTYLLDTTWTWSAVSGATVYRIQIDNNSDFSSPALNTVTASTSRSLNNLNPGTWYGRVRVVESTGVCSVPSTWRSTSLTRLCPLPTSTPIPTATNTPIPTPTSTPMPTNTPVPTATPTPMPTSTPVPTATNTPMPTDTPTPIPDIPGDGNDDRVVDIYDYVILVSNYLTSTTEGPSSGDFNDDGVVNGVDYIIWLNNYIVLPTRTPPDITPIAEDPPEL